MSASHPIPSPTQSAAILGAIASLQRLADLFQLRREQLAREADLTVQQWQVLEQIAGEQPFMPSMFARERSSTPAAVSKIIRQLLDKGIVTVAVSDSDGRQRDYSLTPAGRRVTQRLLAARERAIAAVWAGLEPRRLEDFAQFSNDLIKRLETYARAKE